MKKLIKQTHHPRIQNKLILFLFVVGVVTIVFLIVFYQSFYTSLENERKEQMKQLSTVSMGIIHYFHDLTVAGELESSDAQKYAMNAVASATYGKGGYFWINNTKGELLMNPYTPELVGMSLLEWTDVDGNYIFKNKKFIKKAKESGDWISYYWPKPESEEKTVKISYITYFEPWDWVLGTGVYIDDMQNNIYQLIDKTVGIVFLGSLFFLAFSIFVVHYFTSKLAEVTVRDGLTEAYTKAFLNELLPTILAKKKRFNTHILAAIFFDIDFFKSVNDEHGHDCGDRVLREVVSVILNNTRPDDSCFRYGGEEFLVIGIYEDKASVIGVTERIRKEIEKLVFNEHGVEFKITISAGIAIHADETQPFDETIKHADQKMYQSKEAGRNCVSI